MNRNKQLAQLLRKTADRIEAEPNPVFRVEITLPAWARPHFVPEWDFYVMNAELPTMYHVTNDPIVEREHGYAAPR